MSWKFHLLVLPGSLLRPQSSDNPTGAGGPGWPHSCDWRLALAVSEAPRFCPMWPPRRQTGHLHSMLLSSPAPRGCQQRLQNASRPDSEVTLHHFHHTVLHRIHIVTAFNACHKASPESKKWRNRLHFFIEAAKSHGKGQAYRDGRHYYSHHCRLSPIFLLTTPFPAKSGEENTRRGRGPSHRKYQCLSGGCLLHRAWNPCPPEPGHGSTLDTLGIWTSPSVSFCWDSALFSHGSQDREGPRQ